MSIKESQLVDEFQDCQYQSFRVFWGCSVYCQTLQPEIWGTYNLSGPLRGGGIRNFSPTTAVRNCVQAAPSQGQGQS